MDRKKIKIIVLASVFLVAIIVFSFLGRTKKADLTSEMPEATLPVVTLQMGDNKVNELFGYKGDMNPLSIRDTITPLAENMVLPVTVETFQNHVESISYQVRTLDTKRLLEEKQVADYSQKNGLISTEFQIQNLLEEEVEYQLIITMECEGEEIRYYTRIIRTLDTHIEDAIDFVTDFHEKTFDENQSSGLATYLEPNSEGDNTTLHKVTIHSSLGQITWDEFKGDVLQDAIPSIKEVNDSYVVIVMHFTMAAKGDKGTTEYHNVEEYYRVRYSELNHRMYLLNYERTMDEIFRGNGNNYSDSAIRLGIRDEEVSFVTNENATMVAFVQEGDLWSYNKNTNQLSLIFSFRGVEGINARENNPNHDIRIIKIDESGSMDFVVYGYMNRGEHEGHTGIGVYHYDSVANTIREDLFVQSKEPYQVLKETWGKLFYTSGDGYFYMIAEDNLYKMSLSDGTYEVVNTGLNEENSAVSIDGRYIAWREKAAQNRIVVMDLAQETSQIISGQEGVALKPIGFIESDFVYGLVDSAQEELLNKLIIVDKEQQVVKEYEKTGYDIANAYVEENTVFLEKVKKVGDYYVKAEADAIKSQEIEASQGVDVETYFTTQKQTQVSLVLGEKTIAKAPQVVVPKEVVTEKRNIIELNTVPQKDRYNVYMAGTIILNTPNLTEAIKKADENAGVVIGQDGKCIWMRGKASNASVSAKVLANEETKQAAMSPEKTLQLKGCSLSQVLYFIDRGSAVLVKGSNQKILLIVGYDERNITIYDPTIEETYKKGIEDSTTLFESMGNVFISYLNE